MGALPVILRNGNYKWRQLQAMTNKARPGSSCRKLMIARKLAIISTCSVMASETALSLTLWLRENDGFLEDKVSFCPEPFGFSVIAKEAIAPDTTIVACPLALAITKNSAKSALLNLLEPSDKHILDEWNERQCISCYMCMHLIHGAESK
ncbi:hypothetical protein PM082_005768 [Marasmius tenuissimus]|nr:hypothetical protein PM082_005768 [Marasmius tenuissimus]